MSSIGMVEVIGYAPAVQAGDAMTKSANVQVLGYAKIGGGLVTVVVQGDVGAVKAAVEAGSVAASSVGEVSATHVIARPNEAIEGLLAGIFA